MTKASFTEDPLDTRQRLIESKDSLKQQALAVPELTRPEANYSLYFPW